MPSDQPSKQTEDTDVRIQSEVTLPIIGTAFAIYHRENPSDVIKPTDI